MWLQAILTGDDIATALTEVTPLRIALDKDQPDRYLWLAPPSSVKFIENVGVRITTRARLQWDVVGIPVPISLHALSVVLMPSVTQQDGQDVLSFQGRVEEADLTHLPSLIEGPIVERINAALAKPEAWLTWNFMHTLDFKFNLPENIQPLKTLRLHARWGAVRVTEEGLSLAVAFGLDAEMDATSRHQPPREVCKEELSALDQTSPRHQVV